MLPLRSLLAHPHRAVPAVLLGALLAVAYTPLYPALLGATWLAAWGLARSAAARHHARLPTAGAWAALALVALPAALAWSLCGPSVDGQAAVLALAAGLFIASAVACGWPTAPAVRLPMAALAAIVALGGPFLLLGALPRGAAPPAAQAAPGVTLER